jgi:hypothetical protein
MFFDRFINVEKCFFLIFYIIYIFLKNALAE